MSHKLTISEYLRGGERNCSKFFKAALIYRFKQILAYDDWIGICLPNVEKFNI